MTNCILIKPLLGYISDVDYVIEEAKHLVQALNVEVSFIHKVNIRSINSGLFFGKGFLEQLQTDIANFNIQLIVIDHDITSIQQRNLERLFNCKVIDRTGVIIKIFNLRAKSKEGRLQSQLAELMYQKSRVVKAWDHLEKQRGGGGFIGGPGETQKELDKRMITEKIHSLKTQIKKIKQNKDTQNKKRKISNIKTISLVGYTNAGKSALFHQLTEKKAFVQDMLFATLDTTMGLFPLSNKKKAVLSDTVGFISNLPHQLIEAFHSTLEEISTADALIHVIDASNKNFTQQIEDVKNVLNSLGVDEITYNANVIEAYNKVDLLSQVQIANLKNNIEHNNNKIMISATVGYNLDTLKVYLQNILHKEAIIVLVKAPIDDIKVCNFLYEYATVISKHHTDDYCNYRVLIDNQYYNMLRKKYSSKILVTQLTDICASNEKI